MLSLHLDTRPDWRGGQQQILLLMEELRRRGHAAQLLAPGGAPLARRAEAAGFTVHAIPPRFLRPAASLAIRRILRSTPCDVVHAHDPHALTAAWLAGAHRLSALVAARRVAFPLASSRIGLARYRATRLILAVSQFVAESLIPSGIPREKIEVVPDGVELPALSQAGARAAARARFAVDSDALFLGCVGYLLPEKGQQTLVRAMPAVLAAHPGARLLLAGDGPLRASLEALARKLGVAGAILFAGFLAEVEPVYRALDIFLFPSLAEPLGSSLLAAMSYSLPCIATASGGVLEVLQSQRNGILVPPGEPEAFAQAILALAAQPARAAALAAAARESISAQFSASLLASRTLAAYAKALIP